MKIPLATPINPTKTIHGEYYPHIDGIRALAVIPVVLFHILAALCPGGFAGVDVFFVISGYLITGGILRDLKKNRFTIRNFYYRRIRRIMPAYFAMIACVFAVGCILYYAHPLIALGDAVVAGSLFLANLHFWMQAGDYFASELHSQALLHLWSLSVEEQFYLLIPLFCAIVWNFRRRWLLPSLAIIAFLSFVGAVYTVAIGKHTNAFYFLHFRAWELLTGSLLAMLPSLTVATGGGWLQQHKKTSRLSGCLSQDLKSVWRTMQIDKRFQPAFLGLLMVLIPYIVLSSKVPFPGVAALSSVVGTALLIRYGQTGWVSRMLSCQLFVGVGKISYSLYLWHWPVIVFWKYSVYNQLFVYDYIGMLMVSLLLAVLSWRFVEMPVRTSPVWTMRRSYVASTIGIAVLVLFGTTCVYYSGYSSVMHRSANRVSGTPAPRDPFVIARLMSLARHGASVMGVQSGFFEKHLVKLRQKEINSVDCGHDDAGYIGETNHLVRARLLILGDSHAGSLRYGLDTLLIKNALSGYLISRSSTDMFKLDGAESKKVLKTLSEQPNISTVLLVQRWARPFDGKQNIVLIQRQLEDFAWQIKAMSKRLLIASDIPAYKYPVNKIAAQSMIIKPRNDEIIRDSRYQTALDYLEQQGENNKILSNVCVRTGAVFVPLHLAFKHDNGYRACEEQTAQGAFYYRDGHHLSRLGSVRAASFLMPYIFPFVGELPLSADTPLNE